MDLTGSKWGSYELLERIAGGQVGTVWRVRNTGAPGLFAALEVAPPPTRWSPDLEDRFNRDMASLAKLDHPSVAKLLAYGRHEGSYYCVREECSGGSLASRIREGKISLPLPAGEIVRLGIRIAAALHAAHQLGHVHGDLSPASILFSTGDSVKLFGFLWGRLWKEALLSSATSVGFGDDFTAPEVAAGNPPSIRSDLYSLGMILVSLAREEGREGRFSDPLQSVLQQATAPLENRFPDAGAFLQALETLAPERRTARRRPRRRSVLPLTVLIVAVALLVGAGIWLRFRGETELSSSRDRDDRSTAPTPQAKRSKEPPPQEGVPKKASPQAALILSARVRGTCRIGLVPPDGGGLTWITGSRREDRGPVRSPDGNRVAFLSYGEASSLHVMSLKERKTLLVARYPASSLESVTWAPDGGSLLFVSRHEGSSRIFQVDLSSRRIVRLTDGREPSWSPDGRHIVFASDRDGDDEIYRLDLRTGAVARLTDHPASDHAPAWSPRKKEIAFLSDRGGVSSAYVVEAKGGIPRPLPTSGIARGKPQWSADGSRIAVSVDRGVLRQVIVFDPKERKVVWSTEGEANHWAPTWSPDRQGIACLTDRRGSTGIAVYSSLSAPRSSRLLEGLPPVADLSW